MSEIKLCKDCKWCEPKIMSSGEAVYDYAKCSHPLGKTKDPVTGALVAADFTYCSSHRGRDMGYAFASCGRSAKWFEPKQEAPTPSPPAAGPKPWWRFW